MSGYHECHNAVHHELSIRGIRVMIKVMIKVIIRVIRVFG